MGVKVESLSLSILCQLIGWWSLSEGLVSVFMHQEDVIHVSLCGLTQI